MPYQQIEDYGIIGNLRTAALIAKNGSIDWFCFPRFDSPSVFGSILDQEKGGYYRIYPLVRNLTLKQLYWPETNVLVTRFLSEKGAGEVIDFMPVGKVPDDEECGSLIRMVRVIRGSMRFCLECYPAFNYARDPHATRIVDGGAHFHGPEPVSYTHLDVYKRQTLPTGMKSITSPAPFSDRNRVTRTLVSGQ